jgi:large subunit ribosomal protein L29
MAKSDKKTKDARSAEILKGKSADELKKSLMDLRKDQFNARMQRSAGQLENTATLRTLRRDIARVKTFIQKQLASGKAA